MPASQLQPPQPWQTLSSKIVHRTPWFELRQDQVRTHNNTEITYTFMDHPGVAAVVPVTPAGQVVLIRQYRYAVQDWCWEIPMGGLDLDDSRAVAHKELLEEVGGTCAEMRHITNFYACNGTSKTIFELYLALGVDLKASQPEDTELIEIVLKSKAEAMQMARAGEITDGESALALFLCEPHWG